MLTVRFQIIYVIATALVFSAVALLTGARRRRLLGALGSVLVFTAISAPIDTLAAHFGWWTYPSCVDPPHPPLAAYVGQAFMFVGTIALIGMRVWGRFGLRAAGVLAAVVCTVGLARDLTVAAVLPDLIRFGPMPASAFADMGAWAVVVSVAFVVTRLVDPPGPP